MENTEVVSIESSDLKSILDRLDSLEAKPKKRKWRSIVEGAVAGVDYQPSGMDLVDDQTHGEMVDLQNERSAHDFEELGISRREDQLERKLKKIDGFFTGKLISKAKRSNKVLYIEDDLITDLEGIPPFDITVSEKMRQILTHYVASHEDPTEL